MRVFDVNGDEAVQGEQGLRLGDRVGRTGEPCRWDGQMLSRVVDRIQELGDFSPTNWNSRSVVEIRSRTSADTWMSRPCSSHVYQVTPTAESWATSSPDRAR